MKPHYCILIALIGAVFGASALASISGKNLLTNQPVEVVSGKRGTVVVFMSAKCPCSNSHIGIMKKLSTEFKDFSFVVVHSNQDEEESLSKEYFRKADFSFPVLQDDTGKLADQLKAFKTPHSFLLDADGKVLYKGGVTSSTYGETADKQFLRDALKDVNTGQSVKVSEGRTLGCVISR